MKIFLWSAGQQSRPFPLEAIHSMKRLGSLPAETHAACEGQEQWLPLDQFLALHPLPVAQQPATKTRPEKPHPSRLRGLGAALAAAIISGAALGIPAAVFGVLIPVLWFPMAWIIGFVAVELGHVEDDQVMGALAAGATLLAMFLSMAGLGMHHGIAVVILGGLGMLVSFIGAPWLAFKTGTNR